MEYGYLSSEIINKKLVEITKSWSRMSYTPSLPEVTCAAAIAELGHITSMKYMRLVNLDLDRISASDLASLAQGNNFDTVWINKVIGNLVPILQNIKCKQLHISNMSTADVCVVNMNVNDTQSLVSAMNKGVQELMLGGDVTLHMETLATYHGEGVCGRITFSDDVRRKYGPQVELWAQKMGWDLKVLYSHYIAIEKNQSNDLRG